MGSESNMSFDRFTGPPQTTGGPLILKSILKNSVGICYGLLKINDSECSIDHSFLRRIYRKNKQYAYTFKETLSNRIKS